MHLVHDMHAFDKRLSEIERCMDGIRERVQVSEEWMRRDDERSRWFYEYQKDIKDLVESRRWVDYTRRVIAWAVGAIIGGLMLMGQAWPLIKDHLSRNGP